MVVLVSVVLVGAACSGAPVRSVTPDQVYLANVRRAGVGLNDWPRYLLVDAGLSACIDIKRGEAPKQVRARVADLDAGRDIGPSQVSAVINAAVRAYCSGYGAFWETPRTART